MGHVSSIVKGESTSSKSGVWWQEEKLPDGDILSGKYQSISHYSDGNYAKVWYVGNRFDPERTYTSAYCKKTTSVNTPIAAHLLKVQAVHHLAKVLAWALPSAEELLV